MDHMSMGMGSSALPNIAEFPKFYWAVVGSTVAVAALVNLYNHVLCRQRLSAARSGTSNPAKPRRWPSLTMATTFALFREASNYSVHVPLRGGRILRIPTVGRISLVLANAVTLVVLCLYGLDLDGKPMQMEMVGYRCAVITVGQLPLMFLLAGKNNIIGLLSGVSYERLSWLHRWCARCMLITATLHMGYFFRSWAVFDYIGVQIKTNPVVWKGLASWSTLVWIVLSSMAPIRGWNYELFLVQHVISFTIFVTFVYLHIPPAFKGYVWASVAIFFFDRTVRAARALYTNVTLLHRGQANPGSSKQFLACTADFIPLPHGATRIVLPNPPMSWAPGQHVFLSCHSAAPLQSHPFTIASVPEDGRMEFVIKAQRGATRRFLRHADKMHSTLETSSSTQNKTVIIEGPYGCLRPLRQFDSVVLFAGSTGATFTFPLLRDILHGWSENAASTADQQTFFGRQRGAATRHIRFVWVVKSKDQLGWFSEQLSAIQSEFEVLQNRLRDIKLEITVYVTCDESFTQAHTSLLTSVTPPNHEKSCNPATTHGIVQYRGSQRAHMNEDAAEKDEVRELTKVNSIESEPVPNSGGSCHCRASVDDKTAPEIQVQSCHCAPSAQANTHHSSQTSLPSSSLKDKLLVHPAVGVYAGRPKTRQIIRRSLEQALGESAVVVCGPLGLVADVKQDVCVLSDERAVHKGTGAQGIYVHTESFNY